MTGERCHRVDDRRARSAYAEAHIHGGWHPGTDVPPGAGIHRWPGKRPWIRCASDRGAASVFLLAIGLVFVAAGVAGAAVGAARVGRHEARIAADFGALAGARHAIEGEAQACDQAARLVAANGARITSCEVDGLEIIVRVDVTVTPLPALVRHATATARAGPVDEISS